MKRSLFVLFFVGLVSFAFLAENLVNVADAKRKTRDLVFEEDEEESPSAKAKEDIGKVEKVALKTTIELLRDGKKSTVLPNHEFKSGDRVKFIYTTNTDCYAYWLSQGSSGDYYMLFPHAKGGMDNEVKKNEIYTIPVKGKFRFDDKKGVEKILVILATERVPELEEAVKEAAATRGKVAASAAPVKSVEKKQKAKRKTRDLVFEEDEDEDTGISTKTQTAASAAEPFVVYYELVHN
ncbi:MAG: DUF4384 domain-containing protein [Desulfobacterales bacterium]|uniref:DUF4384 domain-containing protein n=1 Tax=Candidatus Desulfatibia vada TaxID=2841696 RepID=A0A8J6P1A6_9BACT|nr:DUF4384 domain-containing protein [Candidatus Desulfatibia vada]MBL7217036.1 DUF4384 domain-containing protein [Desulfobacteraceae bacterium]